MADDTISGTGTDDLPVAAGLRDAGRGAGRDDARLPGDDSIAAVGAGAGGSTSDTEILPSGSSSGRDHGILEGGER